MMDGQGEPSPTALWKELRGAVSAVLRTTAGLALAEGRLAVLSSVSMIALAVLAGAALFGAWLLVALALAYGAAAFGVPLWAACAGLAVLHVGLAVSLWFAARRLMHNLEFPQTRRVIAESWSLRSADMDALGHRAGAMSSTPPAAEQRS